MGINKLWLVPAALALGVTSASADTLYMNDGRRIQGELISVNRNIVVFHQADEFATRARRLRVPLGTVDRIDLNDEDDFINDDDTYTVPGQASGREFNIRADQQWTDTGLTLRSGETFRLDASGRVDWGPGRSDGPAGEMSSHYNANRPLPNRPAAALIGRIGNGEPFFVGQGGMTFRASNSGRLYLGINDDYLRDNSGSFRVSVNRELP